MNLASLLHVPSILCFFYLKRLATEKKVFVNKLLDHSCSYDCLQKQLKSIINAHSSSAKFELYETKFKSTVTPERKQINATILLVCLDFCMPWSICRDRKTWHLVIVRGYFKMLMMMSTDFVGGNCLWSEVFPFDVIGRNPLQPADALRVGVHVEVVWHNETLLVPVTQKWWSSRHVSCVSQINCISIIFFECHLTSTHR